MKTASARELDLALAAVGCATASPPAELLAARGSYERAQHGTASTLDPADLETAHKALNPAEQSFAQDGDTQATRD